MYGGFALLDHSLLVPYIIVYIYAQFRPYLLSFALSDVIGKGV